VGTKWHFAAHAETLEEARKKLREVRKDYSKRIVRVVKSVEVVE
jgi:hypothetical protein